MSKARKEIWATKRQFERIFNQGLTALASPTVNSYKRLAATESLVPAGAGLGGDNRLSYLRIPSERGRATRVEVRAADASANADRRSAALNPPLRHSETT